MGTQFRREYDSEARKHFWWARDVDTMIVVYAKTKKEVTQRLRKAVALRTARLAKRVSAGMTSGDANIGAS